MHDLLNLRCQHYDKTSPQLSDSEIVDLLKAVPGWQHKRDNHTISRKFSFKNYYETIAFVNAVAWIVHHQDHHPVITIEYNRCNIEFTTHSTGNLSLNDFICAAQINNIEH